MPHGAPSKAGVIFSKIQSDVRALNSAIMIISQKMKYLVRNEKVLGRNLLVLNKRIKEFEGGRSPAASGEVATGEVAAKLEELSSQLSMNSAAIEELRSSVAEIQSIYAKSEDVKEMKFVIDSINPLEFVTYKDVEELVEQKFKGKKARAKS